MRKALAVFGLVLAAGWAAAADDAAAAAKKLAGTYEVVSALKGGKPDAKAVESVKLTIQGGEITVEENGEKKDTAKFTLDPAQKPAHIDIMPGRAGDVVKGIYEAKETDQGLALTLAFAKGKDAARPTDFKGESDHAMVLKLLRKKDK